MKARTRVAVVGAGIMGLAAARALLKRGAEVSVFEQGPIPNPLGSSVDQHRLIRYPYGGEIGYTRMIDAAYGAWDRLWADLGERLYAETGTIGIDGPGADWAKRSAAAMETAGVPFEALGGDALVRRFPHLVADGIETALFQPHGGALFAGRIVERLAHHLGTHGVALHAKTRVADIDPERARLRLADAAVHGFDRVVVAAGPWVTRLVPDLAARVTPSRQIVVYLEPPAGVDWSTAPMLIEMRRDYAFYAVPPRAGTGHKFGDHRFTLAGDPDREREATRAEAEALLAGCRGRFRDGERYRIVEAKTCFYDVAPEERFILEPLGAAGFVLSGFSGHGFKFGALMGELAAAAVLGERNVDAVRDYAAGRGRGGKRTKAAS
jgi:glycine/D-amino acid oxidase-like deaminating enzyme